MRSRFVLACALVASIAVSSCKRPIDGRDIGSSVLTDLQAVPQHIRADVPIDISFHVTGAPPGTVTYDLAGKKSECEPTRESDGRYHCQHPGVTRTDYVQGASLLVVEAKDEEGRSSVVTEPITIDFDCPGFAGVALSQAIAQPGDRVTLSIEANEPLREPPLVTHAGRSWETPTGQNQTFSLVHEVSIADPQTPSPVIVRITDLAGNTSGDCSADAELEFAVDHTGPTIDVQRVSVSRGAPGVPTVITASTGAFIDDVGIEEVRVLDETGTLTIATVHPARDGSLSSTGLGGQPATRLQLEAVDRFGRVSPRLAVPESWALSVGSGSTPNSAIRSASRRTPAPPRTRSMLNRTVEGAPDLLAADARAVTVRTRIAFERVGELPSRYEDVNHILGGYDPVGKTVFAIGGNRGPEFGVFANYVEDVLLITWDEHEGQYVYEQGPTLVPSPRDPTGQTAPPAPGPRYGRNIAFDGEGCGVMFGGDVLYIEDDGYPYASLISDVWQLCYDGTGYVWNHIPLAEYLDDGTFIGRVAPIVWDPINRRYVVTGGNDYTPVLFIETDPDPTKWRYVNVEPLPSSFTERYSALLYWDPKIGGFGHGLGYGATGNGEQLHLWSYANGQWTLALVPWELGFRASFGSDYDQARGQLVLWGGVSGNTGEPSDPAVWFMTKTATSGPDSWHSATLDAPISRYYPTVVYDSDREVTVVFGGVRMEDTRVVPSEIHQIIAQPSAPFLQASIDLAAARPKGIERLHLTVRASGSGDADGLGSERVLGGGVVVMLFDHETNAWREVATSAELPNVMATMQIDITDAPERFVSEDGVVPLTVTTRFPATEALNGRLDVDLIDGYLSLRHGITLP